MLVSCGFHSQWIQWIMCIVSSCQYSILVNGAPCGFILAKMGLRQGDPLSPALFVLMNEYLSTALNPLFNANPAMHYKVSKGMHISHLAYADDCIVFCNGSLESLEKLKSYLLKYESQTGQKINMNKSVCLPGKRANFEVISSTLDMPLMTFPFTYLGAPISKGMHKKILFLPLLEKVMSKFAGWNIDLMSQGGKLTLIMSVLNAIPVYLLQALNPPPPPEVCAL